MKKANLIRLALLAGLFSQSAVQAAPPAYNSASQRLSLPLVKVGEGVYPDVELDLGADGTWTLVKASPQRAAVDDDESDAIFDAAANTLIIPRVHVDGKVYRNLKLDLGNNRWNLASAPQPMRALSEDDFVGDAQLEATLDNVVVLNLEAPDTPVETPDTGGAGVDVFPLRLEAGDYQFCFDRQRDGSDTLSLRDQYGILLLTLKSGDPCVQLSLAAGRYSQEVQYGGSGLAHPLFVHKQVAGQGFAEDVWPVLKPVLNVAYGYDCSDCDLSNAVLPGRYMSGAKLHRVNFQNANLQRANLSKASMPGAYLRGANLRSANLEWVDLTSADLVRANLDGAGLLRAKLPNANLSATSLRNAYMESATLSRADLREANLENADLRGADLTNASLYMTNLKGANLQGANLSGANLQFIRTSTDTIWTDGRKCKATSGFDCLP